MSHSMPLPIDAFQDTVVLVTGGSAGIGRETAVRFAQAGAHVLVTGRREKALDAVEAAHERIVGLAADARHETDAERAVHTALDRWGRLDVLVNNAGAFAAGPLDNVTAETVTQLLETNVLGPTLLAQAATPHLEATGGAIVNVSSTYGHKAAPGAGHYAASKAALESLTRSWAVELAPRGIRVNAVAPGPTDTGILERAGLQPEMVKAVQARELQRIPLRRQGTPGEVAAWIVRLAEPAAAWVTGQVLSVDGGMSVG